MDNQKQNNDNNLRGKDKALYTRQQKSHSIIKHILLCCVGVGLFTIPYYSLSPNHYWHAQGIIKIMANVKKKEPTKKQFFDILKQVARKKQPAAAAKKRKTADK